MKLTLKGLVKISFSIWVLAIIAFVIQVIANQENTTYSTEQTNLMIGTIITGVFSFGLGILFIIVDYLFIHSRKSKHEENKEQTNHVMKANKPVSIQGGLVLIIVILLVVVAYLLGSNNSFFLNTNKLNSPSIALPTPASEPTDEPVKQTKEYLQQANTNTDQPVHCNVHPNCGGGTTPLKKSECDNSICCQVNGKWVFYKDKYQCGVDQGKNTTSITNSASSNTSSSSRSPVFISYLGVTYQCPTQNVGAIMSINSTLESKKNEWTERYSQCVKTFQSTDSCYTTCSNNFMNNNCSNQYGYSGSAYDSCFKQASDTLSTCYSGCPSTAEACNYVYSEQKSLVSQISNLCK